jgi:hypothetical protein
MGIDILTNQNSAIVTRGITTEGSAMSGSVVSAIIGNVADATCSETSDLDAQNFPRKP